MKKPSIEFSQALLAWYDIARRKLPWRAPIGVNPPAYHVFISEAMLQQTQVATVIPYFERFISEFPTLQSLANSDEQRVLRLWQGLGYYSRARNLRKSAIAIIERHGGLVPRDVIALRALPGIGRYTAGAIASLAFEMPAPILDGNVVRVLCRIDAITQDPRTPAIQRRLWARAEALIPIRRAGDFNSAMMELGATICVPKNPACLICPVRSFCNAFDRQLQNQIPQPRKSKETPMHVRYVLCLQDADGRYLIEQRPATGRWAGLWQFITRDADDFGDLIHASAIKPLGTVRHALTHRRYQFHARWAEASINDSHRTGQWKTLDEMSELPFSRPHLKLRQLVEQNKLVNSGAAVTLAAPAAAEGSR